MESVIGATCRSSGAPASTIDIDEDEGDSVAFCMSATTQVWILMSRLRASLVLLSSQSSLCGTVTLERLSAFSILGLLIAFLAAVISVFMYSHYYFWVTSGG